MTAPQPGPMASKPSAASSILIIAVAVLSIVLGSYQWYELYQMRTSGSTPLCAVSDNLDCGEVWSSALATAAHSYTGLPFSAWGVAWGIILLILGIELHMRRQRQTAAAETLLALRFTTGTGALLALGLLVYSIQLGVFCLTCILFYCLVGVAVYVTYARLQAVEKDWSRASMHSAGLLLIVVAALLYPGLKTPKQDLASATLAKIGDAAMSEGEVDLSQDPLAKFLQTLTPEALQAVSDARALYRIAPVIDRPIDVNRIVYGNPRAPVHVIDWIDIRCPHCRSLDEALTEIRSVTPTTSWTEEARHFPLDSECNGNVSHSDGAGVACLSAKLLICLAGSPQGNIVRSALFAAQRKLNKARVWEIAAQNDEQRATLEKCIASPDTASTLRRDIDYAIQHRIEGTPLVVINGRQAPAFPPFIYAMIIAAGDSTAAGFRVLPAPRPEILAQ